jgi:hypothetical protein
MVMTYSCDTCEGTSGPVEAEPKSWERWDGGETLLCARCSFLRRTGGSGNPLMLDKAFSERLGARPPARETPKPQIVCAGPGCKQPFDAARGGEFCVSCQAKRDNPRNYQPHELVEAGLDPVALFGGDWI